MHDFVRISGIAIASLATLVVPGGSEAALGVTGAPHASFVAVGPGGMKILGSTSDLGINDDGSTLTVTVSLSRLATGIGLRDSHMREKYLEVAKYPDARLVVSRSALHIPTDSAASDADAPGELSLHGAKRKVTFHYHADRSAGKIHVTGTVRLDMRDYAISVPSYLGVTVKPAVDVNADFMAKDG
jgi:polyisoprenoid-binding protein YceI